MKNQVSPAENVVQNVCKIKENEKVLIIANPSTFKIANLIFESCKNVNAKATLIIQNAKTSFDNAEDAVLAAIKSEPDVCFSISEIKLGKDPYATENPYISEDGQSFSHIFDFLLEGKKSMRAVWTPGLTEDMFNRTVNIDYKELSSRCKILDSFFKGALSVHVTSPGGTDVIIPVENRNLMFDDGDFSKSGSGGNIPAGEVFISPVVGSQSDGTVVSGKIVFDGSMTFSDGDAILSTPIECILENGLVTKISGGAEAERLLKTVTEAENRAIEYEKIKKLPSGMGKIYAKNARNIGELGIGLNPNAKITGNMLEDEKAFTTCHFAIGENYDNDAPSLIHLDGIVKNPTIVLNYKDKESKMILKDGILQI